MSNHEYFERLGVLAALERLSGRNLETWNAHVRFCDSCRAAHEEHSRLLRQSLGTGELTNEEDPIGPGRTVPDGYRERFLAKARVQGIQISKGLERIRPTDKRHSLSFSAPRLAVVLAIVILTVASVFTYRGLKQQIGRQRAKIARLGEELSAVSGTRDHLESRLAKEVQSKVSLQSEISSARKQRAAALARVDDLERKLAEAKTNGDVLHADLVKSGRAAGDLHGRLQAEEGHMADLGAELHDLRAEVHDMRAENMGHSANTTALRGQVKQLSAQLEATQETEARDEQLLAAGKDIRNLMGARNLHVIDVFDANGVGANSKVFGRVFYTEGKSLVFYAFDLGKSEHSRDHVSYVAWGKQADAATPAKELGIFYVDDINERRWVLRFDNPKVLREINAVFVTIEHENVSHRPTGRTLLYAYLDTPANHP